MREHRTQRVVEAVEGQLRRRTSPRALRRAYRAGYLALRPWWFLTRPHTLGVKAVVRRGDEVLVVRHTYARRDQWDLPGGYLRPDEEPEPALRRELSEELGIRGGAMLPIASVPARFDHKRERLHVFAVDVADPALRPSVAEIAAARWVARDALPPRTTRLARQMVARAYWELWEDPEERVALRAPNR